MVGVVVVVGVEVVVVLDSGVSFGVATGDPSLPPSFGPPLQPESPRERPSQRTVLIPRPIFRPKDKPLKKMKFFCSPCISFLSVKGGGFLNKTCGLRVLF